MTFTAKNKVTIGLTGGILCGKSAALAAFKRQGAYGISCDEVSAEVSARPAVQRKIKALFGAADKAELAAKVFSLPAARKQLENLLHPLIEREIARCLKEEKNPVRVVEVPLLFEAGWQDKFDLTLCILAPQNTLAARMKKRGLTKTDFLKRSKAQFTQQKKASNSDICLLNDASAAKLEEKINSILRAMHKIYQSK